MEAMVVELVAYLFVLPLRLLGWIGGRRVRERTQRAEAWLLRSAWQIGASGVTINPETHHFNEGAHQSVWALKYKEQAELDLERTTPELERRYRRIETTTVDAPRSEQMKEAMLEAQRLRRAREQRSVRSAERLKRRE